MSVTIKATIRPTETRELVVSGEDYEAARAAAEAATPDGWQVLAYLTVAD